MREVEVAVGLTNGTWSAEWVEVNDDGVYLDETLTERAEEIALAKAADKKLAVSFVTTLYLQEPKDQVDDD